MHTGRTPEDDQRHWLRGSERFRVGYLQSGLGCMALKRLLLLSGGMDSIALAWALRPDLSLTIDYGQLAAAGESRAASAACTELGLRHRLLRIDCSALGSGDMAGTPPSRIAPVFAGGRFCHTLLISM